jgi:hypothetical protein
MAAATAPAGRRLRADGGPAAYVPRPDLDGAREFRPEWGIVASSPPVTRAPLAKLAPVALQIAPPTRLRHRCAQGGGRVVRAAPRLITPTAARYKSGPRAEAMASYR